MSGPHYARLASRVLAESDREPAAPPRPEARAVAISALERAIAQRARARKRSRWVGAVAAAAAVVVATTGGARYLSHRDAGSGVSSVATQDQRVVGHALAGAASVFVAGQAAPVEEGRPLPSGSRIVTEKAGRVLLAFATGTSGLLEDAGDVTLDTLGTSQQLRLDSGSIDLHVSRLSPDQRFVVRTADSEIEVRGTQFRVSVAQPDPSCGAGTTTRVSVTEGVVVVRHAGSEDRVTAGQAWPSGCAAPLLETPTVAVSAPSLARASGPTPASASTLGVQNDMFAQAIEAKRRGDTGAALAGFDRFLARYPGSPLAESASVERMRLLRSADPGRAAGAAKAYLARYPRGFAHSEAEAIVAGSP